MHASIVNLGYGCLRWFACTPWPHRFVRSWNLVRALPTRGNELCGHGSFLVKVAKNGWLDSATRDCILIAASSTACRELVFSINGDGKVFLKPFYLELSPPLIVTIGMDKQQAWTCRHPGPRTSGFETDCSKRMQENKVEATFVFRILSCSRCYSFYYVVYSLTVFLRDSGCVCETSKLGLERTSNCEQRLLRSFKKFAQYKP